MFRGSYFRFTESVLRGCRGRAPRFRLLRPPVLGEAFRPEVHISRGSPGARIRMRNDGNIDCYNLYTVLEWFAKLHLEKSSSS